MDIKSYNDFLERITVQNHFDYYVAISGSCSAFVDMQTGTPFLTEYGFLVEIDSIAKTYADTGKMPSIAIFCDTIEYGRYLNKTMSAFIELMLERYAFYSNTSDTEKCKSDFIKAIYFWIYNVPNTSILLEEKYQWRLNYDEICSRYQCRKFAYRRAQDILKSGVAVNTYNVLSAASDNTDISFTPSNNWSVTETVYYGHKQQFYVHNASYNNPAIILTVRCQHKNNRLFFIPQVFVSELTIEQVENIYAKIFEYLNTKQFSNIDSFIRFKEICGKSKKLSNVLCQFLLLVLSQIALRSFFVDYNLSDTVLTYNTSKIARNFGYITGMEQALSELCSVDWSNEFINEIYSLIHTSSGYRYSDPSQIESSTESLVDKIQDAFYRLAVAHEQEAIELSNARYLSHKRHANRTDKSKDSNQTGEINTIQFFADICPRRNNVIETLSYITLMMDSGDIILKPDLVDNKLVMLLCSTELTLSIMPKRLGPHFESYYRLLRITWRDENLVEWAKRWLDIREKEGTKVTEYSDIIIRYAELLSENREALQSMIDWRFF